jgi:cyclic beta-1,2-glucan synthetase
MVGVTTELEATAAQIAYAPTKLSLVVPLILLFDMPFNLTLRDPGYIKAPPPCIRESGGQYTHVAVWAAWAHAELGQGGRAVELFDILNPINHADTPE